MASVARVAPGRVAVIEGDRSYTWARMRARVARLAALLAAAGAGPDSRVAVLAQNGISYFEAWFAVSWAGAVLVPLNTRLAPAELDFQLRDAGVSLLLHDPVFADRARHLLAGGAVGSVLALASPETEARLADGAELPEFVGDQGLAGIFYTGGTTGLPKGVMLSHANLTAMAMNLLVHMDFAPGDVLFHAAPMFHLADIGTLF